MDAIDKTNNRPLKRDSTFTASPHALMIIDGQRVGKKEYPNNFLPFAHEDWIFNTAQHKQKLYARETPAQYLRCVNKDNYHAYKTYTQKFTTFRTCEFALTLTEY